MLPEKTQRITVRPVDRENWRAVRDLEVAAEQYAYVAVPSHYLALCCYDDWNPLAIYRDTTVIGFLMWAIDEDDGSCWLGGILVDKQYQHQGYGRKAVAETLEHLAKQTGATEFALSYQPSNTVAAHLYGSMGFTETGEQLGDEVVARLPKG